MRSPAEMQTIQVELTSACVLKCSNCTRFSGTHVKPNFLSFEEFKAAIDSLVEYSRLPHAIIGFMGGEPLLHHQFPQFCEYALSKIDRAKLGLWSTFPDAPKYKAYGPLIVKTFGVILLNDHSRDDIKHAPVLMASEEYFRKPCDFCKGKGELLGAGIMDEGLVMKKCPDCGGSGTVTDDATLFQAVEHCWVQESWSASINNKGAFFCEVAAALDDLFGGPGGWPVEPGWWKRTPKDFQEQMDWACRKCGAALPLTRIRNSQDPKDDVSPGNLERLKAIKSKKVARGEFEVREKFEFDPELVKKGTYPHQTYKEEHYRQTIAARYGIRLVLDSRGYWEPTLASEGWKPAEPVKPLFEIFQQQSYPVGVSSEERLHGSAIDSLSGVSGRRGKRGSAGVARRSLRDQ